MPKLRAWLGGSAGSGKSTTLKTCVAHVRLLFRQADIPATVALTAYTGVAAFNMSFGAKTACSTFQVFPNAPWKKELSGESLRKLEAQWRNVVLLIVDEISFIGTAFFCADALPHTTREARIFQQSSVGPKRSLFRGLQPLADWRFWATRAHRRCIFVRQRNDISDMPESSTAVMATRSRRKASPAIVR